MADTPSILEQFDAQQIHYREFSERLQVLLQQLLRDRGIPVHSISARVKTRESFVRKTGKKDTAYPSLADVTDITGVRVITYFADQVDEVAKVIESEFDIDVKNSIDKRAILDPDRFGYLSLHYVVSLSQTRCALPEYRSFRGLKAEVQLRSILQHAWAEIEHDLGYKTSGQVPRSARRKFARLASLLELADDQFVTIRLDLDAYSREVTENIAKQPSSVYLDRISLVDFAKTDPILSRLDQTIADNLHSSLRRDDDTIANYVDLLKFFRLETIEDLKTAFHKYQHHIVRLSERWGKSYVKSKPKETIPQGVSLFYLCHILAGASQDVDRAIEYYKKFVIGPEPADTARDIVAFMKAEAGSGPPD